MNDTFAPIRAAIVEDEPKNIATLKQMLLAYCPQIEVAGIAKDAATALSLLRDNPPQLVFMDIELPGGNAFSILEKLKPVSFEVIFITAYDSYPLQAIKFEAIDYLLKPINIEELVEAVNKAEKRVNKINDHSSINQLLETITQKQQNIETITLYNGKAYEIIRLKDVIRCESVKGITKFYLVENRTVFSHKSLNYFEGILPATFFFRAHLQQLINTTFIRQFQKGKEIIIEMKDGASVTIAQRKRNDFLKLFPHIG